MIKFNATYAFYFFLFLFGFITEYIFNLPSQIGDDKYYINLISNICYNNNFFAETSKGKWLSHGFFREYLLGKLNYNCSIRNYFLINFLFKLLTFFFLINTFKKKNNFLLQPSLVFLTFLCQTINSFRPEGFSILIIILILYCREKFQSVLMGFFGSLLLFSQPTIFFLFGSIFFLLNYSFLLKNFLKQLLGFSIFFILAYNIYPYNILDYFNFTNDAGVYEYKWFTLSQFFFNYIYTKFFPLFFLYFFILFIFLLKKKIILITTLPVIIIFGPLSGMHEYNLMAITPYIAFCVLNLCKLSEKKIFVYMTIFIFVFGYLSFFLRNLLTMYKFGNNYSITSDYIKKNIENINILPSFVKFTNPEVHLKINSTPTNSKIINNKYKINLFEVNGTRKNCPTLSTLNPSLTILDYKLFNSNSSYDVYICEK
jgi:hypothetical protein